jgi:hypothetical protein
MQADQKLPRLNSADVTAAPGARRKSVAAPMNVASAAASGRLVLSIIPCTNLRPAVSPGLTPFLDGFLQKIEHY